jgi:regulator of replication initiation timing
MGIQKKNTKAGGIKKNKRSFVEENPCLTLEDIEALTIKKKDEI